MLMQESVCTQVPKALGQLQVLGNFEKRRHLRIGGHSSGGASKNYRLAPRALSLSAGSLRNLYGSAQQTWGLRSGRGADLAGLRKGDFFDRYLARLDHSWKRKNPRRSGDFLGSGGEARSPDLTIMSRAL
jgi:hypothetical protein